MFWQRDDVGLALGDRDIGALFRLLRKHCGASQTRIGIAVGLAQAAVSPIMCGRQQVTAIAVLERIADGLQMPDEARMRLGLAPKEDPMRRRTALGLGLAAALSPDTLTTVLRESAAEAMEFTREVSVSAVGPGTLEHLTSVIAELDRAYEWHPADTLFPVARAYRNKVDQLLNGPHTLSEARELYVHAAHLSHILSDLAHDLGSPVTADAYAIDCYRHAEQAGHNEFAAWACLSLTCWAVVAGRGDRAIEAAERGIGLAPAGSPIAARLNARAAQSYALRGDGVTCADRLSSARSICERLPSESPSRLSMESNALTSAKVTQAAAYCHVRLADYGEAERDARAGLAVAAWSPGSADTSRLDLAVALTHLGSPDEAVEQGKQAIAEPRFLGSLIPRSRELYAALKSRYPNEPFAREFQEQYRQLPSHARTV